MPRLLLVDDEPYVLNALRRVFARGLGDESPAPALETFEDPRAALSRATEAGFDLALVDYRMPGLDGIAFLEQLRQLQPGTMRLVLSGHGDFEALVAAVNRAQIFRFIAKPWNDEELRLAVRQALAFRDLEIENRRLADLVRVQRGEITRQELELRRLRDELPRTRAGSGEAAP